MYICLCTETTDHQIRKAVEKGAATLDALNDCLGVAGECGQCEPVALELLNKTLAGGKGSSLEFGS